MGTNDISWLDLLLGFLIIIIPFIIFRRYKTGLVKEMSIAFLRMSVQLMLVGFYLQYIFLWDSIWLNLAWVALMASAACASIIKRSGLRLDKFLIPVGTGVIVNVLANMLLFSFVIIGKDSFYSARYIIPVMGMIVGNTLSNAIIGLRSFYKSISDEEDRYKYMLLSGAVKEEALFSYMSEAFKTSFAPTVASTAGMGLIWLPGMMTGQILGGNDPMTAIKYQILIVTAIFAGGVLTVYTSLRLSKNFAFDEYDMLKKDIFIETKQK